jgi:NAD(P)-dependent dehydrogenase (short-subunit alcohol dehydrogenase family)
VTATPTTTALVTGAGSGIGRATALRLASEPERTILAVDRDHEGLEETVAAAHAAGGRCVAAVADLTSSEDCARAIALARELGRLDTLVNAAGTMTTSDSAEHVTDEQVREVLDINVGAVFRLCRGAIPAMRAGGGGAIVNVASVHAYASMMGNAVYASSKGALVALTRQLALDVAADGIRVVGVAPGAVDTPMSRRELSRRGVTAAEAGFPTGAREIGRIAMPEEVAETIVWLASPAAKLVNATTVVADAGLLARLT